MRTCPGCHRQFPAHLVQPFTSFCHGALVTEDLCPLCVLPRLNKMHGLPPTTPFCGVQAQSLYREAIDWIAKKA